MTRITVTSSNDADTTSPTARDEFWYDPHGQRYLGQTSWDDSGQQQTQTVYFGNYEKVVTASGIIERTDLSASVRHLDDGTSSWFEYVHRDHLGSVDVITSSAGTLINSLSHDPFGGRRDADWSAAISTTDMATILANEDDRYHRGFTDHEQLNRTGFIHMNGRVYDPRIGRFVSPDPIVQAPAFSQNYNRYSYVFNNPLSATDPSGFTTEDLEGDGGCYGGQGNCSPRNANTDPFANGRVDEVSKQLQRSLWKRRFGRMVSEFYGSLDRYERFAPPIHWFAKQASGAPVDRDVAQQGGNPFEHPEGGHVVAEADSYPLQVNPATGCYVWDGQCAAFKQVGGGEVSQHLQSCSGEVASCVARKVGEATAVGIVIGLPTKGAEKLSESLAKGNLSTSIRYVKGASKLVAPISTGATVIQLPVFYQYCTLISPACSESGDHD